MENCGCQANKIQQIHHFPVKIVHYNLSAEGGAAVLMLRLHAALRDAGHDSRVRYRKGNLQVPEVQRLEFCQGWLDRQRERIQHRFETWALVPDAASHFGRSCLHKPTPPLNEDAVADIVHLHWISRWLDLPGFLNKIPRQTPIIWTIHDMSALAGGCFTDFGCDQIGNGCRCCPLLKPPFNRWLAANEWRRRARALAGRKLVVVGNSAFTTGLIRKSALFRGASKITTIHPALHVSEFIRHDKSEVRRLLGIAPDRFVLGFGAATLTDENKGFNRFMEVAEKVAEKMRSVDALVFGDGLSGAGSSRVKVHGLGRLSSPLLQSLAYSAMNVFVLASRMETFGQVAIEAQACGTPVWAFDVGGLRDAVQNSVTGRLIQFPDTASMAESICAAAANGSLSVMGDRAAEWARKTFSVEEMSAGYIRLYDESLSSSMV
jgi:glycosyltransferase involved in cell wall biosynthesis